MRPTWLQMLATACAACVVLACSRHAPTPQECERFALRWHGTARDISQLPAPVAGSVRSLTLECLGKPLPRRFVLCVDAFGRSQACSGHLDGSRAAREPLSAR